MTRQSITELATGFAVLVLILLAIGWLAARRWTRPTPQQLRWFVLASVPGFLIAGVMQASVSAYRRSGALAGLAPRYVYPAAGMVRNAKYAGADCWLVNAEPAANVGDFDQFVQGKSAAVLPGLLGVAE